MNTPRPWHPYLFGLFPILFLYVHNTGEASPDQVIMPTLVVLGAIALLVGLVNLFVRNIHKTALVVSVFVIYWFSFGHLPVGLRHHKNVLAYVFGLAVILAIVGILRSSRPLHSTTRLVNYLGLGLVILQMGLGGWAIANRPPVHTYEHDSIAAPPVDAPLPNIYYIIPDGYGRGDVLATLYDYDNSEFLSHLRDRGFYVADSSFSNYPQTFMSLTSSLNMKMIDQLGSFDPDVSAKVQLKGLYDDNRLYRFLKQYDYKIVSFHVSYDLIRPVQADYLFRPWYDFSEFSQTLIQTTPLEKVLEGFGRSRIARERIEYILDKLTRLQEVKEPYFVLAHVTCPHPPFFWDENGNASADPRYWYDGAHGFMAGGGTRDEFITGFRNQTRALNRLLLQTVDGILASHRDHPPIVIIQSDHGPDAYYSYERFEGINVRERFGILNAYYLPGADSSGLYPSISPVNSFRVVLNNYFGLALPLLEDRAYYSPGFRPFDATEVTDRLVGSPE